MFSFQWPWLISLLLLPLIAYRFWPAQAEPKTQQPELRFPNTKHLTAAFKQHKAKPLTTPPPKYKWLLLSVAWLGLTLAVMYPQWLDKHTDVKQTGYDLMLAVDLSGSMRGRDFVAPNGARINRLEATKIVLAPFIKRREGDRIGLILFADHAYLQAPLTLDTEAVGTLLEKAALGMAGRETAIGDAIGLAVKKLRERPSDSRALILLTDGNNTAGVIAPQQAAELAKQYGIRIYTIGVGSVSFGQQSLNEAPLREISELTGGTYFPATDLQALANVYQHIGDNLLKTEVESRIYLQRTPLYPIPLTIALLALLGLAVKQVRLASEVA